MRAIWVCTFCKLVLHSFRCFEKETQKIKTKRIANLINH